MTETAQTDLQQTEHAAEVAAEENSFFDALMLEFQPAQAVLIAQIAKAAGLIPKD